MSIKEHTASSFVQVVSKLKARTKVLLILLLCADYGNVGRKWSKNRVIRTVLPITDPSTIANGVSYFCNFHGPSLAVDSMSSSSLTAIHLACHSIQRGDCELALAGGVNVLIHLNKYLLLGQGKFISSLDHCESFGPGADGYVPAEGVGAILLKPLAQAETDGDHIYGVIKATAINHGGKTNNPTIPNPHAQADVIRRAIKDARIDPRTISYIEAQGMGTVLGDPIEIAGLTRAFASFEGMQGNGASGDDSGWCAIGSVKSNIGHAELRINKHPCSLPLLSMFDLFVTRVQPTFSTHTAGSLQHEIAFSFILMHKKASSHLGGCFR